MIAKRFHGGVNLAKPRTCPVAGVGSDHNLMLTVIIMQLEKLGKKSVSRLCCDVEKPNNQRILEQFQVEIGGRFWQLLTQDLEPKVFHEQVSENIFAAAETVLGKQKRKK